MKNIFKLFPILLSFFLFGQNVEEEIKKIEGVWIAEDYYNSFEKTESAVKSKNAFDFNSPVALRINSKEIKKGILNIGYSQLHDHMLYPEVSDYIVNDKDTIRERRFKINLNKKDSIGYYKTTHISYFFSESIAYLTLNLNEPSLVLYIPEGDGYQEKYIQYKRVSTSFKNDYLFPNPLYYYTRFKTLQGYYTLKDSLGNILSENFEIKNNGIVKGFELLENFTAYFSTDIYCGPPARHDLIMIFENILIEDSEAFHFIYMRDEKGNINLFKRLSSKTDGSYILGKKVYELIKHK